MDKETLDIQRQIKLVGDLVDHEGWEIVAKSLNERINLLSNLSGIKVTDYDKEKLYLELRARELFVEMASKWLEDVLGTAEVAKQNFTEVKESYTVIRE